MMKRFLSTSLFAAAALFGFVPEANAGIEACGDINVKASAMCTVEVEGGCEAQCTPLSVQAACHGRLQAECDGECMAQATVECTGSCEGDCQADCEVNPPMYSCSGECVAEAEANCAGECEASNNRSECEGSCKANA